MVDEHADDVAEGFGVPRMVNHCVDVFRPRPRPRLHPRPRLRPCPRPPPPRHRLGHLLDARLADRTTGSVYLRLNLKMRLCHVAVLGGYQQIQQTITTKVGGEHNDRISLAACLLAAFQAARFAQIVSAMVGARFSFSLSPSGRVPKICLS